MMKTVLSEETITSDGSFELVQLDSDYDEAQINDNQKINFLSKLLNSLSSGSDRLDYLTDLLFNTNSKKTTFQHPKTKKGLTWLLEMRKQNDGNECCALSDEDKVALLCTKDIGKEIVEQIDKDLPRTFANFPYFRKPEVVSAMRRILQAIAVKLPELGYVQGMSFIVGFLYLHCETTKLYTRDQMCFLLFLEMLLNEKLKLNLVFCNGLPNVLRFSKILQSIVEAESPQLSAHLEEIGLGSFMFCHQWTLTLFSYSIDFSTLKVLWDELFISGWNAMFKLELHIILKLEEKLLKGDFAECFSLLRDAPADISEEFVREAMTIELKPEYQTMITEAVTQPHQH